MKLQLDTSYAADLLVADESANWSYAGARALVEWLEQLEEDQGQEMDLDIVALRCEYSEYKSLDAWATDYFGGDHDFEDEQAIRNYIEDNGYYIEFNGGVIVSSF